MEAKGWKKKSQAMQEEKKAQTSLVVVCVCEGEYIGGPAGCWYVDVSWSSDLGVLRRES
jgi:hypothetical protein